jgi:hypothetical protein
MTDIQNPKLLYLKGALMLATGLLAALLLLLESPSLKSAVLLGIAIWGCARAYYFAFYVIEHYVDPSFRFAGLTSFALYILKQRSEKSSAKSSANDDSSDSLHPQSTVEPQNRSVEH